MDLIEGSYARAPPPPLWPPAARDAPPFGPFGPPAAGSGGVPFALGPPGPYAVFGGSAPGFGSFPGPFGPAPPSFCPAGPPAEPQDERAAQRRQDARWLQRFSRDARSRRSRRNRGGTGEALARTVRLVRELQERCDALKLRVHSGQEWDEEYVHAARVLGQLRESATGLDRDRERAPGLQSRTRRLRARALRLLQRRHAEEARAEREASICAWRMKRVHEVEERKKEQELKLAADSVLCEVRRKQADLRRMQDVMRSLQKLRRLRKEAASRRGIVTEQQCDAEFEVRLEELRSVMRRRATLYSSEEKALMVMLEGEQEGERQRERDRRLKKEAELQMQRRRTAHGLLFGEEEHPADFILQAFTQYYSQAQHSLYALIQIRKEWDVFLVASDHPSGSTPPEGWIAPDPPSDEVWASALQPEGH
ncbi:unnamed protein product [Ophioblennius macclurei]